MKGQPPKSAGRKALQGNPGKRKTPAPVAEPVVAEALAAPPEENPTKIFFSEGWNPPEWLPAGACQIWIDQLPTVLKETKLQQSGLPTFAQYCLAQYRVQQYTRELAAGETYTTPSGYIRNKPQVELREKALKSVVSFAESLNLTPKSWINSMGGFASRQLDMFLHGGKAPAVEQPSASPADVGTAPEQAHSIGGFLASRPTLN